MGLLNFSVTAYGQRSNAVQCTSFATGGNFTTSTTASDLTTAAGPLTLQPGQVIMLYASVAMRVRFHGDDATATTGHFIPPETPIWFECREAGTVSVVDLA